MDGDGSLHTFVLQGNGSYDHPPGIHSKLEKEGNSSFTLWHKDGSRHLFTAQGELQRLMGKNGNNLTFSYQDGKLSKVEDDSGLFLNFTYDGSSRVTSVEDPGGRNISFVYTNGNLTSYFDALGNESKFGYDANRRLTSYLDPVGRRMAVTYDAGDRVTEVWVHRHNLSTEQDEWGYRNLLLDYVDGSTVNVTNARVFVTTVTLDANQNPVDVAGPQDQILGPSCGISRQSERVQYVWDPDFQVLQLVDGRGNAWNFTYDGHGNLLSRTDPTGNVTSWGWTHVDNGTAYISLRRNQTNARGFITSHAYDTNGNLVNTTDALGNVTSYLYDVDGFLVKRTDRRAYNTTYAYDPHGWLLNQTNPLGHSTLYAYDNVGRRVNVTSPLGFVTRRSYNANDWLLNVTDPLNFTTTYTYNARGDQTSVTDANGFTTSYEVNVTNGRIEEILDATGNTTAFAFDNAGSRIRVTDPNGHATTFQYDALNRLINETTPGGNSTRYSYDGSGNRISRIDADGKLTSYEWDDLSRIVKITYPGPVILTADYDANGNTVESSGYGFERTEQYDALDRTTSRTFDYGTFTKTVSYEYDAEGLRTKMVYPDGFHVEYAWDGARWLTQIEKSDGSEWTFAYDAGGRSTQVATQLGPTVLERFNYTYDNVGNRLSVREEDRSTVNYTYDVLYRLTQDLYDGWYPVNYTYDAAGNRLKMVEGPDRQETYTLRPVANGAVAWSQRPASGQNYDKVDEVVHDGDATHVYAPVGSGNIVDKYEIGDLPDLQGGQIDHVRVFAVAKRMWLSAPELLARQYPASNSWPTMWRAM